MAALYALSAFFMTLAGGAFALRYQRHLLYIMAFSAGLLVGVALLDVIPEVVEIAAEQSLNLRVLMSTVMGGFIALFLLEKLTIIHSEKLHDAPGHHHRVGLVGALGLSFHSLLDGLAIGVAFRAGTTVGFMVLFAILAHGFSDGLNTVTFMLSTKNSRWRTVALLFINALAPVVGASLATFLEIDPRLLAFQLAFFAGSLLYLGASDLLPDVHERPRPKLIVSTLSGVAVAGLLVYVLEQV